MYICGTIAREMFRRLSSMLVLASMMLSCCSSVSCGIIQFSFIPSPNIQLSQAAIYRCSVSHVATSDTVSVQWKVNGISSSNSHSFMSYTEAVGISTVGIGTQNSTITVPGTRSLNGTTVECLATGILRGDVPYGNKSRSILYVQGKPGRVNLMCETHRCRKLHCNWSTPHTIADFTISQYNINITMAEDLIVQGVVTDTQYTIDLSNGVSYTVTVVAVTGNVGNLIEGEVDRFQIKLNTNCNLVDPTTIDTINTYSNTHDATTSTSSSTLPEPPEPPPLNNNTSGNTAITAIVAIAALAMVSVVVIAASYGLIKSNKIECTRKQRSLLERNKSVQMSNSNTSKQCDCGSNTIEQCDCGSNTIEQCDCGSNTIEQCDYGSNTIEQCDCGMEPLNAQPSIPHNQQSFSTLCYCIPQPLCYQQSFSTLYDIPQPLHYHQSFSTNDLSYLEIESEGSLLKESGSVDWDSSDIVKTVDYIFVVKHVCREIPEQWKNFATAMNINEDILEDIRDEETNDFHKFCRVIEEWKNSNVRPFTWHVLERVLNELGKHEKGIHDLHTIIVEQYFEQ